jgi:type II secretory pathway pseudopilin PulG
MIPRSLRSRAASAARPVRRRRAGFLLIELMIAMTLLSIVMSSVVSMVISVQKDYARQRKFSEGMSALRNSQLVLDRLFRTAGADPNNINVIGIVAQPNGAGSVRIRADFNPADGDVADPLEDVQVELAGGEMRIRWEATGTVTPLVNPVSALTFEYFRRDGTQLTNLPHADSAKRVRITITSPIQNTDGTASTLRSQSCAFVRN